MNTGFDTRGQTLYDFAIGMTIFLVVVGYVFAFIPGLFAPFSPETDSSSIRVDRTADFLTEDLLASPETASRLDVDCTEVFFDVGTATAGDCAALTGPGSEDRVRDLASLTDRTHVNVTMVRNGSIGRHPDPETGEPMTLGPDSRPVGERVIRAVRVVSFDGRDYQFTVRIW